MRTVTANRQWSSLIEEEKPWGFRKKNDTDTATLLYCKESAKCMGHCFWFPVSAKWKEAFLQTYKELGYKKLVAPIEQSRMLCREIFLVRTIKQNFHSFHVNSSSAFNFYEVFLSRLPLYAVMSPNRDKRDGSCAECKRDKLTLENQSVSLALWKYVQTKVSCKMCRYT